MAELLVQYISHWSAVALGHLRNADDFSFSRSFRGTFRSKRVIKFLRRLKEGFYSFLTLKSLKLLIKCCARAQLRFQMTIQSERSFFNNKLGNNWKPLFEVNFSQNSTKTIRLSALKFYEVIVDEAGEI